MYIYTYIYIPSGAAGGDGREDCERSHAQEEETFHVLPGTSGEALMASAAMAVAAAAIIWCRRLHTSSAEVW